MKTRTDDQWFAPSDKVMLVDRSFPPKASVYDGLDIPPKPDFGVVYCVEDFFNGKYFNLVMLVGFGGWRYANGQPVGWPAACFRKVEEIRLCAEAGSRAKAANRAEALKKSSQ